MNTTPPHKTPLEEAARRAHALAHRLHATLIETHISWVLLAGENAYKLKKPVRFAFVDYASVALRRHCCEEELRLNARLAPGLYLGVVPVVDTALGPVLGGPGRPVDYAVHMRRFADNALLSEQLAGARLVPATVDRLAALIGRFHLQAPVLPAGQPHATPALRAKAAQLAWAGARELVPPEDASRIGQWLDAEAARLQSIWAQRRSQGRVRECHGDLHLANLLQLPDGQVQAFDCIEFDPALRWIDVVDDAAFVVMDFCAHGRRDLAYRFLNGWLDWTGDHDALRALAFSVVYRALVRAQVRKLSGHSGGPEPARYIAVAQAWMQPSTPRLVITCGLPGSGKTFASSLLAEREGLIRLRSDVERKRLHGLALDAQSRASGQDIYDAASSDSTYAALLQTARLLLRCGWPVVLDAAFLRRQQREQAHQLALSLGVPFGIVACEAPEDVLRQRLVARRGDASEADASVLQKVRATAQPLSAAERALVVPMPVLSRAPAKPC